MTYLEIYQKLEELGTAQNRKIYKRHRAGDNLFGVSFGNLRALQKKIISPEGKKGKNHEIAQQYVQKIERELQQSPNRAKEGMNNCLIAIGARNEALRGRVLEAAKTIGKVEIDHGETSCKTFIIEEYLDKIYKRKTRKS